MTSVTMALRLTSWVARTCIPHCSSGEADTAEEPTLAWQLKLARAFLFAAWLTAESRRRPGRALSGGSSSTGRASVSKTRVPPPLTLAILGQVSPAKLGPEILWKRTDFWKSRHAYFRRGGNAKMDWRVLKACSHIFHWYQSHMAGFHY